MSYAVRNDGQGWRAVNSADDCASDETFSEMQPLPNVAAQLWSAYQSTAQAALTEGDMVAIRCAKAGVAYPAAWLARDVKLRAIVSATSGDPTIALPVTPPYPTGT
jgi:hypothetical protein